MEQDVKWVKQNPAVIKLLQSVTGPENDWAEEEISQELRKLIEEIPEGVLDNYVISNDDELMDLMQGKIDQVDVFMVNIDDAGNWEPLWAEQDLTMIQIQQNPFWNKERIPVELWAEYLIKIFAWLDCTGCCNAIEYVKVGQFATLIKINSGRTYHS